jgi:PTH1 family peptidyl-tRNA hydrolase
MKLIVGLGNPGAQHERTRHNAGFLALDALAERHASGQIPKSRFHAVTLDAIIGTEKVLLMKPTGFMNRSGQSVGEAIRFFKLDPQEDMIVLVDDIALPVGHIRVRKRGGTGGHNGLSDIDRILGGEDYPRVRIGVGNVPKFMDQSDWVLSKFMKEEQEDVLRSIKAAADATVCMLDEGITKAMNAFNTKLVKPKPDPTPGVKTVSPKQSDSASDSNTQNQETKNASAQPEPNNKMENENVN